VILSAVLPIFNSPDQVGSSNQSAKVSNGSRHELLLRKSLL
jgi:hypothetical protein